MTAQKIRAINSKFLKHYYVTDVITFDYSDGTDAPCSSIVTRNERKLDGEIIISTDAVRQNAKRFKIDEARELALYIIHGILHLLGYDDKKAADKQRMRVKEEEVLVRVGEKMNVIG